MKSTKTAAQQMYGPLADLSVDIIARQVATQRFDFGRQSAVASHLVAMTLAALEQEEQRQGIVRLPPFVLRLDWRGSVKQVPLLEPQMLQRLIRQEPLGQLLRSQREKLFVDLFALDSSVTLNDVRRLLAPTQMLAAGGRLARRNQLPAPADVEAYRMDLAELRRTLSIPDSLLPASEQLPPPPASVVAQVAPAIESEGRSPEMARSFISHMLALRERYCPRLDELAPGQLSAIALGVGDRRMSLKTRYRRHVPVRLTLYEEAELAELERAGPRDRHIVDQILGRRVARIVTQAYCQGGLLSLTLVGLMTHQSPARTSRLVNEFEATHRLILPTPGTIHDAGSKLTHKATIVALHLQGKECKEIARDTFHSEEAVGRYLDDFERVLIAKGHELPSPVLSRVLKLGAHVVAQYEELIRVHIGDNEQIRALLANRGLTLDKENAA